ncbi:MAG: type IV toxin-antitoxin system AbiEi family antitoxin [Coriobacteriales bacterium]|jgi:predicted transcriptional regulator of viral defense system|nr:type IV toxin-antitoxin system AbiEi family antitoxin [Coriobacteriales bacterium]
MMTHAKQTLAEWIDMSAMQGKLFFSLNEVAGAFPDLSGNALMTAIGRQIAKGSIQSLWRGFYGILVYDYGLRKIIPVSDYIDLLMQHLGRDYYVALLTAAALQGAAHQVSQTFMVMVKGGSLRTREKNGVRIKFFTRSRMSHNYRERVMVKTGYMTVSAPELTALDVVARMSDIGGLSRTVEVLEELAENLDFTKVHDDYFSLASPATVQRLGYLLETEVKDKAASEAFFERAMRAGLRFRTSPLAAGRNEPGHALGKRSERWKIVPNKEVEVG